MKKFKIHLLLLLLISSASQAQKGLGLPVWPLVTASPNYLEVNLDSWTNQSLLDKYTPHEVIDWRGTSPSWTTVPGTAPTKGPDNWAQSQAGFDDCGNMVFYVLHTGNAEDKDAAEFYRPDGTLLLGKSTTPSAPNANRSDREMQVVKRPGYNNQWFIIYSKQHDDGYYFVNVLYSLIEIEGNVATYVTLNNVLQKDITLEAPALEASPNCNNTTPDPRIYLTGKAVSRTSKTIGNSGHDLYLYRVFEQSKPRKISTSNNKHIKNTTFSVDRFEISANGIQWSANSGPVEGYIWQLMSPSTTMELSPDEKKLCVVPTSDFDDITKIFIFNLDNGSGSCSQYLNNFPKVLKVSDLLVVPDENNSDFVDYKYIEDKGTISSASEFPLPSLVERGWTYKITNASGVTDNNSSKTNTGLSFNDNDEITWDGTTWIPKLTYLNFINSLPYKDKISFFKSVKDLASSSSYLTFLSNFQKKLKAPQFSPDGNKLYVIGGGYVPGGSGHGHLSYLAQIDLSENYNGNHPVRLQIQTVKNDDGAEDWNTDGKQKSNWGDFSTRKKINAALNYNSLARIQQSYNGHIYFTKARTKKLFILPNPNTSMDVNLVPGEIDFSDENYSNLETDGFALFPPDQIDGYNYLNSNYISVDIPFEYKTKQETDNGCELVCSPIDLSLQDQDGNIIAESTINDCGVFTVCVPSSKNDRFKLVGNGMEFDDVIVGGVLKTPPNSDFFNFTTDNCSPVPCEECKTSFSPQPGREYLLSAWVKEEYTDLYPDTYQNSGVQITFNNGADDDLPIFKPTGPIIDGWQRIEQSFVVPYNAENIQINLKNLSDANNAYFDDVRVHTFSGNMKSYVYDPSTQKLTAELDENNYATKYEYDDEGILIRVKKETTRGVMTIKESRNNQSKINK